MRQSRPVTCGVAPALVVSLKWNVRKAINPIFSEAYSQSVVEIEVIEENNTSSHLHLLPGIPHTTSDKELRSGINLPRV
jgi:hypothetical protein